MFNRNRLTFCVTLALTLVFAGRPSGAQSRRSPEVDDQGKVTFRLVAPQATKVSVSILGNSLDMEQGDGGIWSVTSEPLEPGIHEYSFNLDGTRMVDSANRWVKKWRSLDSLVEVPGKPPLLTEFQAVPHGEVRRMIYQSESLGQRPLIVYTPPGYDPERAQAYPLLMLLHGSGDDESAWTDVGRAHFICDNLIHQGQLRPLVIAMPYGHPSDRYLYEGRYDSQSTEKYRVDVVSSVLPFLEQHFHVSHDRGDRFVAGLSMGGGQAIDMGLSHPELFSAIGAFSAATPQEDAAALLKRYPALAGDSPQANDLSLFWIPIGKDDFLLDRNREFVERLKQLGIEHEYHESAGGHQWPVWREYLPQFLLRIAGKPPK